MLSSKNTKNKKRCSWPGADPLYVAYHDTEWGVPEWEDRALFEKLILDGFQAGLAWITLLRKRDSFREAFDGFNPEKIARYNDRKITQLLNNPGIIRHRGKIESTISNARIYLELADNGVSFSGFLWDVMDGTPRINRHRSIKTIPAETKESLQMSKLLKSQGFRFCGPTIVYAFMQAVGMVNDHITGCFRHEECVSLATKAPKKSPTQKLRRTP